MLFDKPPQATRLSVLHSIVTPLWFCFSRAPPLCKESVTCVVWGVPPSALFLMISISEHLIRSARRYSLDGEGSPMDGPSKVEDLMSHSPPVLPHINQSSTAPVVTEEKDSTTTTDAVAKHPKNAKSVGAVMDLGFEKVTVERKPAKLASSLSKGLKLGGLSKGMRGGRAGRGAGRPIKVLVGQGEPFKVSASTADSVEDVILSIINEYVRLKRQPPLAPDPDMYELLMLDDDEPDDSLPPLARGKNFCSLGVDEVALCPKAGSVAAAPPVNRPTRGPSLPYNDGRRGKFVKVTCSVPSCSLQLCLTFDCADSHAKPRISRAAYRRGHDP